jgi:hypothetical protein
VEEYTRYCRRLARNAKLAWPKVVKHIQLGKGRLLKISRPTPLNSMRMARNPEDLALPAQGMVAQCATYICVMKDAVGKSI